MRYTEKDLERYERMFVAHKRDARDCLIRIVAIRKELGSEEPNRFQESLAKLKKGSDL